ncbi:alginate lyase 2 [Penicillium canariense]|uniref:Alginate lyase 2 n=1 Tax=Penicillium canariense TaxID=189055 RepID=A0A9W9I761_9EURO|nr:alginate lyase 2 [Penicillium canariense]KAJ5167929.1 alginate lyase 2 [Penicillium canariense]
MTSKMITSVLFLVILQGTTTLAQLDPKCAPGGNFNLEYWNLQLPTGSTHSPDTISSKALQGCSGYEDSSLFYTESSDGALVMKVCGSSSSCGCVTTPGSLHCRTELRELASDTGSKASWSPLNPVNRLSATLVVPTPDDSTHGTVIGQVHIDDTISSKPICELYYSQAGVLTMGVEQTRSGGNEVMTTIGKVPVGTKFTYEIAYEGGVLSVSINGGAAQKLSTYSLDNPDSYFKAGNYNQGSSASEVHFFAINVDHGAGSVSTSSSKSTTMTTTSHAGTTTTAKPPP